ncbi:sensor histidine kinase [Maritalea porphyrae]|jgi:two-component system sensor histidine kinase TctE|uniref:sensor histidine kinase n=1 Tax=Maritalea porphyrae TaxID=880732 RepID=UPI0022AF7E58|nr:sensor histidine kinase [Maritalea porphyrae]MCZ4272532.1 sensor histidine kinase [Maritalea porphyrae]
MIRFLATTSIRRRLVVQLSVMAALLSIVFFVAVRSIAEQAAADTQDNILAASATSIADALYSERGQVRVELPYSALSMLGTISEDRVFYRVVADDETVTGYGDLAVPDVPARQRVAQFVTSEYRGEEVRVVSLARAVSNGERAADVRIIIAQTRRGLAVISSQITSTAMAVAIGFFLMATALSLLAAQSAVAPLKKLAQSVTRRGPKDLRPVVTKTPGELVPLVDALNNFMMRLRASLTRSEEFIAEAAHRVRTPLATVRTQAEVVYRQMEKPANRKALREMIRAVDESSRSAGQLLDHAMVTFRTDQLERDEIDLCKLAAETCERLQPTAELKDIEIIRELVAERAMIFGDNILLQNAVRNILDNAIKYSPAESSIVVRVTQDDDTIKLSVTDQGRGFANADLGKLTARFSRGVNVDDIVGSGLGLTIADEVVRAHNGQLRVESNKEGVGACVVLVFKRS